MQFIVGVVLGGMAVGAAAFWLYDQKNSIASAESFDSGILHACLNPGICPVQRGNMAVNPLAVVDSHPPIDDSLQGFFSW